MSTFGAEVVGAMMDCAGMIVGAEVVGAEMIVGAEVVGAAGGMTGDNGSDCAV